ncbi:MAG: hypothetical protein AAFP17_18765 [Pseudomonadota bacterium]
MKALCLSLLLLLVPLVPTASYAQILPGSEVPALRAAANAWLTDKDPRAALWAIGQLAADGNPAARQLARQLSRRTLYDFPRMSRADRRALFPPDRTGQNSGLLLYPINGRDLPTVSALRAGIHELETPEDWISRAEALLAAGFREEFQTLVSITVPNYRHLNIEVATFAETVLTDADRTRSTLWWFRRTERSMLEFLDRWEPAEAAARRARWGEEPWTPSTTTAFAKALREERWSAIWAAGMIVQGEYGELPLDAETADLYRRWTLLATWPVFRGQGSAPLSVAELEALGAILINDAERSPYLRPLSSLCHTHCPEARALCMAAGLPIVRRVGEMVPSGLEPITGSEAYYTSWRAARYVLSSMAFQQRRDGFGPEWLPVPQCLRAAAAAEAERVWPKEP